MSVVLIKGFAAVARWRWQVLLGALVCSVTLGVVGQDRDLVPSRQLTLILPVVAIALFGLSIAAQSRYRPAVLVSRHGAITTVDNPWRVFMAAAFTVLGVSMITDNIGDVVAGEEDRTFSVVLAVIWVIVVALQWYVAMVPAEVRLSPDGVLVRSPLGSRFVPWEALGGAAPAAQQNVLVLHYTQPDLVRTRGLRSALDRLAPGTDVGHLARAIQHYETTPEHRPAIGTEAEFRRLTAALTS